MSFDDIANEAQSIVDSIEAGNQNQADLIEKILIEKIGEIAGAIRDGDDLSVVDSALDTLNSTIKERAKSVGLSGEGSAEGAIIVDRIDDVVEGAVSGNVQGLLGFAEVVQQVAQRSGAFSNRAGLIEDLSARLADQARAQYGPLYDADDFSDLISYFPLNGSPNDYVGANDLTESGSPSYTAGVDGDGVVGDGTDDALENTSPDVPADQIAVSVWVDVSAFTAGAPVIALIDSSTGDIIFGITTGGTDSLQGNIKTVNDGVVQISGPTTATGSVVHALLTYDGEDLRFYQENTEEANNTSMAGGDLDLANTELAVAGSTSQGVYGSFNVIDEGQIFHEPKSASEVDEIYNTV